MESREVWTENDIGWLEGREKWKDLTTIIAYRSKRAVSGKTTEETRYYISSRSLDAEEAGELFGGTGRCGNEVACEQFPLVSRTSFALDVCFGEDHCLARKGHEAENLNVLRKMALYLMKSTPVLEKRLSNRIKMFPKRRQLRCRSFGRRLQR